MPQKWLLEIMHSEKRHPFFSSATLVWAVSLLYGAVSRLRRKSYDAQWLPSFELPCPVISVGNLTVGGTGKTPMVIQLAKLVRASGRRVVIVSRGYKGLASKHGTVVSDGRTLICGQHLSGDEPYLMATLLEDVPVVVGKDRWAAGKKAFELFKPDVILLDDAFQHLRLKRDVNLLLLDARKPFGNFHLLPRGILREPATTLAKADAVVLTRSSSNCASVLDTLCAMGFHKPIFCSRHRSIVRGLAPARELLPPLSAISDADIGLKHRRVFAFSGLADNRSFVSSLRSIGCSVEGVMGFQDHHPFDEKDIQQIVQGAAGCRAACLVTTDKDYVRLSDSACFPLDVMVLGVDIEFEADDASWQNFVMERIRSIECIKKK